MELVHPLDGLDARPWSSLRHAYGSADDLPDLLRALAGPAQEAAGAALSELYGSVLHQGTVYAASAEVVPFLARIAAAGHRVVDVLALLGGLAESEDEHGVAPGTVRDAVARQLPLLLPLLTDGDPEVRRTAAWAVSHTRAAELVLPALRRCWEEETEAPVRAEVLAGISRLDRAAGAVAAATVLAPSAAPELRLAAVFACLDADVPWTRAHHTAMLSVLPADPLAGGLDLDRTEPLSAVVGALLLRDRAPDREAASALVDAALRDDRADVRAEARWAAERACVLSRSAPARLLDALRAAAVDEESVLATASLFGRLGPAAAPAADVLAGPAARNPGREDDGADRALAALVLVAPGRAAGPLAEGLGRRPRALAAAAGFPTDDSHVGFPYDGGLLTAVRRRLGRPEALSGNESWQLTALLRGWGARAVPALPELYGALAHVPAHAAPAIAAIARSAGPAKRAEAARCLRAAAGKGSLPAARALYDVTGEHTPLVDLLAAELRQGRHRVREAAVTAADLGARARDLTPELRAALGGPDGGATTPDLDADTALADALWRITGDAATTVAALDSVFARAESGPWTRWAVVRAARATALLGPAGRPLTGRLEALLDDPVRVPAAALALVSVADPAALDRTALAEAVLRSAERAADPDGACDALHALGRAALSAEQLRRLAALADGDLRTIRWGVEDRVIRQDEAFRGRVRDLLTAFTTGAPATATP
ncbi:HEAT repeat domain-containing protein [Streptomyces sp. NPDC126499]|uniref:HEAT repeat domain-containing protein n=1 Tax=Streptomyces sp. NPDC126499 TaxID=3155314 RepID=UPI00332EAFED